MLAKYILFYLLMDNSMNMYEVPLDYNYFTRTSLGSNLKEKKAIIK